MRDRIWKNMANIKFKAIYTNECSRSADSWGRAYSFFLSFASASSVATWATWKELPVVWACIVGVAQLFHLGKPHLPFLKHDKEFLEMSFEFDSLYLEYERLWVAYEDERITKIEAEDKFYKLREREAKIEKAFKQIYCPRFKGLIARALQDTISALSINFNTTGDGNERKTINTYGKTINTYGKTNTSTETNTGNHEDIGA